MTKNNPASINSETIIKPNNCKKYKRPKTNKNEPF